MAVKRRTLWLAATLIVALVAAIVVRSNGTANVVPGARTRARGPEAAPAAEDQAVPAALKLEALKRARGEPADIRRDPFRFRPKPAPEPPPSAAAAANRAAASAAAAPLTAPAPSGPPPPPPIPLKFIGIVEKIDGTRIAVLSDGRRPYHGVEGQEIEGQYRILKIGVESIEIAYLDGRGRQTIRLTGK